MSSTHARGESATTTHQPAISGVLRVARSTGAGLPDLRPGDILLVDVTDLDSETAEAIAAAQVGAVLNLGRLTIGRYANLGPRVLAEAGVIWVDDLGHSAAERLVAGAQVRIEGGAVQLKSGPPVRTGRRLDLSPLAGGDDELRLRTRVAGRTAVVAAAARREDQRLIWSLEPEPVIVSVGRAADDLHGLGWVPDVAVVDATDPANVPSAKVLRLATDVVVVGRDSTALSLDPETDRKAHRIDTDESATAVALRLIERQGASLVVAVRLAAGSTRAMATPVLDATSLAGRSVRARGLLPALLAIAVALGLGIAMGVGPLSGDDSDRSAGRRTPASPGTSTSDRTALRQAQAEAESAQSLVGAVAPQIYAGRLTGHGVVVIGLPGAPRSAVTALSDQVRAAGGAASRTVQLRSSLLDATNQTAVDSVGTQLLTQLGDPRVDPTASTYVRMGQLLALATTTSQPVSAAPDPTATAIRGAVQAAGLAAFPNGVRLAPQVLLVLPSDYRTDTAETELLGGLIDGLATTAVTVVVVGDGASGRADGGLAALREQGLTGRVSTVDGIDLAAGQVGAVLALVAGLTGTTGSYGVAGADGPIPATG